jgi:hypothetical protein
VDPFGLIAIDPGKHHLAWAKFLEGRLVACGLAEGEPRELADVLEEIGARGEAVIEVPRVYPSRRWRGDPNDLIDVALTAGVAAGVLCRLGTKIEYVRPGTWKKNVPKRIHNDRVRSALDDHERLLFETCGVAAFKRHNVLDAIGLGLWRLGRKVER